MVNFGENCEKGRAVVSSDLSLWFEPNERNAGLPGLTLRLDPAIHADTFDIIDITTYYATLFSGCVGLDDRI